MGTRGSIGVRVDGVDKLAYNHFDSYPEGLGVDMLAQARALAKDANAAQMARDLRVVDEDTPVTAEDIEKYGHMMNLGVGEQSPTDWYCLLREAQGSLRECLDMGVMLDAGDFIRDSLFCEWAYIINFDTRKLEVYEGFKDAPHTLGRFATMGPPERNGDTYYPCALIAEFDLDNLPSKAKFLKVVKAASRRPDDDE